MFTCFLSPQMLSTRTLCFFGFAAKPRFSATFVFALPVYTPVFSRKTRETGRPKKASVNQERVPNGKSLAPISRTSVDPSKYFPDNFRFPQGTPCSARGSQKPSRGFNFKAPRFQPRSNTGEGFFPGSKINLPKFALSWTFPPGYTGPLLSNGV